MVVLAKPSTTLSGPIYHDPSTAYIGYTSITLPTLSVHKDTAK